MSGLATNAFGSYSASQARAVFSSIHWQGELALAAAQRMALECDRLRQNLKDRSNNFFAKLRTE